MSLLIISEKENAAKRIANILSRGSSKRTTINRVPVHRYTADGGEDVAVVGLRGHVFNVDYPPRYNNWFSIAPARLVEIDPIKVEEAPQIVAALRDLSREADDVIIATDYDREGELIGVEALNVVLEENGDVGVKRSRFSALTPQEVNEAFAETVEVDHALAQAGETRQIIDLVWGAVLTRFLSMASSQVGSDFLSVGRVQTPTLALIVDREIEIEAFVPVPYWEVWANCDHEEEAFRAHHKTKRFNNRKDAEAVMANVDGVKEGTVTKMTRTTRKEKPPAPFNTTSFLAQASSLKMGAAKAMDIAEDLYTNGYISYPRTDNTVYPASLDLRDILEQLRETPFKEEAERLLAQEKISPSRGKTQTTDHPPIHPAAPATEKKLKGDKWKVYEMVVRRFMATVAWHAHIETRKAELDIGGEPFRSEGAHYLDRGWRDFYPYFRDIEKYMPDLKEGETVPVENVELLDLETKPPARFSQGKLIQGMDRLGLGTKSTRHTIIQKLYARNYIESQPLRPTATGRAVISALENHARTITEPDMTATLEADMTRIAEGETTLEDIVTESRQMLGSIMEKLEAERTEVGNEIKVALREQNTMGTCPSCGDGVIVAMRSRRNKRFAGCVNYPDCRQSYPLPQRGRIEGTGVSCEVCGGPRIALYSKGRGKSEFCINMDCASNVERLKEIAEAKAKRAAKEKAKKGGAKKGGK
ncbi:MAG: DNA topoisomerase I, partial [Thermoplasmata archaeon]|nr:DNA topoisomerase I [Thermoplasmata archaeon]